MTSDITGCNCWAPCCFTFSETASLSGQHMISCPNIQAEPWTFQKHASTAHMAFILYEPINQTCIHSWCSLTHMWSSEGWSMSHPFLLSFFPSQKVGKLISILVPPSILLVAPWLLSKLWRFIKALNHLPGKELTLLISLVLWGSLHPHHTHCHLQRGNVVLGLKSSFGWSVRDKRPFISQPSLSWCTVRY